MRQILRSAGIVMLSLFSLDIVVGILDWLGRWDWLVASISAHPRLASFVRTPFAYLGLSALGFLFFWSERRLKQPRLLVQTMNMRSIPVLETTPIAAVFESEAKTPGWDERKLDWDHFVEVQVTNDSEIPTTVSGLEVRARIRRKWFRYEPVQASPRENFDEFVMDLGLDVKLNSIRHTGDRYRKISSLMEEVRNVPLTRGIGHRGWLRFRLSQVSQKDMNNPRLKIACRLVDALGGKHELEDNKGSEQQWARGFYIFKDKD